MIKDNINKEINNTFEFNANISNFRLQKKEYTLLNYLFSCFFKCLCYIKMTCSKYNFVANLRPFKHVTEWSLNLPSNIRLCYIVSSNF